MSNLIPNVANHVAGASINAIADAAAASLTNGWGKVGWVHLQDKGLPPAHYLVFPPNTPFENRNIENFPTREGVWGNGDLRYAVRIMSHNNASLAAWCAAKQVPDEVRDAVGPLALAIRGAIGITGCVNAEHSVAAAEANDFSAMVVTAAGISISFALTFVVIRAINHFSTNHCTTGNRLQPAVLKMITQQSGHEIAWGVTNAGAITDLMYWAMHPADERIVWNRLFNTAIVGRGEYPSNARGLPRLVLDDWLNIRRRCLPAGTHVLSLCAAAYNEVCTSGLAAAFPNNNAMVDCLGAIRAVKAAPLSYHPGAVYYGKEPAGFDAAPYKAILPNLAHFLQIKGIGASLLMAPAMRDALQQAPDAAWAAIVQASTRAIAPGNAAAAVTAMLELRGVVGVRWDQPDHMAADIRAANEQASARARELAAALAA